MSDQKALLDVPAATPQEPRQAHGTKPRRPINGLKSMRGYRVLEGTEAKPLKVAVRSMDTESVWERLAGAGGIFEQVA